MTLRRVLIIDDHPGVCQALELLLSLQDIETAVAASPEEGLALLEKQAFGLVIQDMNFTADTTSGEEGERLFRAIRARRPDLPIILLTAWTRLDAAVALVKAGAADYLAKPWDDAKLVATVENLLELGEANREIAQLREARATRRTALARRYNLAGVVFGSDAMANLLELAGQIAAAPVPVLITGPNGAGKERIAAFVHANSAAREGAFVALNCGALPAELIEAELFGSDSGAYTGAAKARVGRFEAADGGTLFLDEIANLPLAGQVKLLRVLETGQFERLGSSKTRQTRVRVLSATNAELRSMVRSGAFREDLFYRLNLIELRLPPLAERRDDVLPLAEHFLAGRAGLSEAAREALLAHRWPGNVRELKNAVERAALLCQGGEITPSLLGLDEANGNGGAWRNLDEPSREAVVAALAAAGGVVSRAATQLGLSRQALYRRLERYGIQI
ncbi:sigma-54-dependent transcriptional regulator [Pelomonas sp. Root405]|uniref:sigma-54-dependent transcriptional regulator n=1 Tax=unclassified Roseateles TaxID=2626991 RepID=UPI000AD2996F